MYHTPLLSSPLPSSTPSKSTVSLTLLLLPVSFEILCRDGTGSEAGFAGFRTQLNPSRIGFEYCLNGSRMGLGFGTWYLNLTQLYKLVLFY